MAPRKFKVVLLGEGRVCKTSILLRYVQGTYEERQVSTLQASYLDKKMVIDNQSIQLSLWDTAGQERFHALGPIYYRGADGALLVYDITDEQSFEKVKNWVKELRKVMGNDIHICIAGNKIDLQRNRQVDEQKAKAYAISVGATHFNTSAKLNKGLEEAFTDLSKKLLAKTPSKKKGGNLVSQEDVETTTASSGKPSRTRARGPGIQIVDDDSTFRDTTSRVDARIPPHDKKSTCC